MTRRLFTIRLCSFIREQGETVNGETPDKIAGEINAESREYVKLQEFEAKRRKWFNPRNDAVLIGTYERMATCHEKFAGLFKRLAESLRGK